MNLSSKQFTPLLKASLLLIVMGFSFLWGQKKYTASADLTIPANVTKMTIKAWGAGGGGSNMGDGTGGAGGFTRATAIVTPGAEYRIVVGKPGGYLNFREQEGSRPGYGYPRGDSVWVSQLWYYGKGGCDDIDNVGCGSMSNANIWPQVAPIQYRPYWGNTSAYSNDPSKVPSGSYIRWPTFANGDPYPVGYVLKSPADPNWNTWNGVGATPGPKVGSGGQMSAVYLKSGDPLDINNYMVISGGGGGGTGSGNAAKGGGGGGVAGGQNGGGGPNPPTGGVTG